MLLELLLATLFGLLFAAGFYFVIYDSWRSKPANVDKPAWPLLVGFVVVELVLAYFFVVR